MEGKDQLLATSGIDTQKRAVSSWLDLYPFSKKETEDFGHLLEATRLRLHSNSGTPDVVRAINDVAFSENASEKERRFLMRIKYWIFRGAVVFDLDHFVNFDTRVKASERIRQKTRKPDSWHGGVENWWGTEKGVYCGGLIGIPYGSEEWDEASSFYKKNKEMNPTERVGDFEHFIVSRTEQLLAKKERTAPVVLLDFGGMQSISFLRIASYFKEQIKEGKVVVVVSNLSAGKNEMAQSVERAWSRHKEYDGWIKEAVDLVWYIQADAEELQTVTVKLPDSTVTLKGNTSLVHESNAISAHGLVNERDFPLLGELLSGEGILMTNRSNLVAEAVPFDGSLLQREINTGNLPRSGNDVAGIVINNVKENQARIGLERLRSQGVSMTEIVPDGKDQGFLLSHSIFTKPTAPELKIFDSWGREYLLSTNKDHTRFTHPIRRSKLF